MVLVYRMPAKPTAGRVAVWRQLKKAGAIYLQQSVCVFPENSRIRAELAPILQRITSARGESHLLPLRQPPPAAGSPAEDAIVVQLTRDGPRRLIERCEPGPCPRDFGFGLGQRATG